MILLKDKMMNYQDPLFLIPVMTGPIFILAGFIMLIFPPKKINMLYGYRTRSSMKDQEHWDFAQGYSSKKMMIYGGVLTLCSVLSVVIKLDEGTGTFVGLGLMILMVILLIVDTEYAIRKKFEK